MWGRILKSEKCLADAPVLVLPSGGSSFMIYIDASKYDLECILIIHEKVIIYASRELNITRESSQLMILS